MPEDWDKVKSRLESSVKTISDLQLNYNNLPPSYKVHQATVYEKGPASNGLSSHEI